VPSVAAFMAGLASGSDNSCPSRRMPQPQLSMGGVRGEYS
jgi:hypothetical protein